MVAVTISPKGSHREGLSLYLTLFPVVKGENTNVPGTNPNKDRDQGPQFLPVPPMRVQFPLHQGAANKALEAAPPVLPTGIRLQHLGPLGPSFLGP